jgi:16S rRNA (cytidine1402-2'-O)-methyltransferase
MPPTPAVPIGTLYLIPTNLSADFNPRTILPDSVIETARRLDCLVAENAKSARAFLKAIGVTRPIAAIRIGELNEHTSDSAIPELLSPLLAGHDLGLVSEAGAPAVADPGAKLVAAAHAIGARVVPCVGPSSILLGLMASGLNGQRFAFQGYLPTDKAARTKAIVELERESRARGMTQAVIETPYRNRALLEDLLKTLSVETTLCIAADLTGSAEAIVRGKVGALRASPPALDRIPALFLFQA